jgi:hypothetical protein
MSILSRLERIRGQIANCGGVLVTFKDGTRRTMDGGDCVHLIMTDHGSVERFESRNEGQGQFPDLLNDLLENT